MFLVRSADPVVVLIPCPQLQGLAQPVSISYLLVYLCTLLIWYPILLVPEGVPTSRNRLGPQDDHLPMEKV